MIESLYPKSKKESIDMDELRQELILDEGIVHKIYLDHLGHPTFGVGHLITEQDPEYGKPVGSPISHERVFAAFDKDISIALQDCFYLYGTEFDDWPKDVQHVLVNMMFNLGRPRLRQFVKMKDALCKRNWPRAAKEGRDSLWYTQVPNRAERLMKRLENAK